MHLRTSLLLALLFPLLIGTSAWAATSPHQPTAADTRVNPPAPLAPSAAQPLQNVLSTQPASAPQALNADGTPADDAPEAPHYYRWVDEQGHVHFSDRPPEGKTKKVKKEALTPVPENGGGTNITQIYQRANQIMTPPTPPGQQGQHGGSWTPSGQGAANNGAHQPDAPPSSP